MTTCKHCGKQIIGGYLNIYMHENTLSIFCYKGKKQVAEPKEGEGWD